MPLLSEVSDFLDAVRVTGVLPPEQQAGVAAARRASREGRRELVAPLASGCRVRDRTLPGPVGSVPVRCYRPGPGLLPGCVVWIHGGGWVLGDLDGTDAEASRIAVETGCTVVSVGYRLAPEHRFPSGLHDCRAAVDWVLQHADLLGYAPGQVVVGGISSGANLAAVLTHEMRALVRGQILAVGLFDAGMETGSWRRFGRGYLLDRSTFEWFLAQYLAAGDDALDPRISPLRATDLSGLPPALVLTAEYDPLRDGGVAYAERLRQAGVAVTFEHYAGVIHGFLGSLASSAPAEAAFTRIGVFVRDLLATPDVEIPP